jgi:geranylgeranyl pyrophosphate synthase
MKRMDAEARKSRCALNALLAQVRKPVAGSTLWPTTRVAVALCSGSFEKAYLTKLSGRICGAPKEAAELAGLAAELFMFAALTVDDWADGATFRAGQPAIHSAHGPQQAVLTANCLIEAAHLALNEAAAVVPARLRRSFLESFRTAELSIQAGQADVLALSGKPIVSIAVVERLARLRCGRLIAGAMAAGGYLAGRTELLRALEEAGEWLGIALQYRNDIQDFTVSFDQNDKPPMADLSNGQPNLVVCLLFQALPHMRPRERTFLTTVQGSHRSKYRKALTKSEFIGVLDLIARYRVGEAAASELAACVVRSKKAVGDLLPCSAKKELGDYMELLLQP